MPFAAGEKLTASKLNTELNPLFAYKNTNESVTNSTTLQDDNELFVSVAANTIYKVEASIGTLAPTAVDGKYNWGLPSGATFARGAHSLSSFATGISGNGDWGYTFSFDFTFGGAGGLDSWIRIRGLLDTAASSGTFRFRWAQNVASASSAWVLQGSWLRLTKVA